MRDMAHAQVSTDAQENDLGFEVTPFERMLVVHEGSSSVLLDEEQSLPYRRHFGNTAAQSAHRTFVARADAFAANIQRFVTDRENKKRGIRKDLMEKRGIKMEELKTELDLYNKLLGVQREEIEECINHMEEQAQELIGLYAIGVKREREAARAQAQAMTGDEEDEEEGEEAIV